MAWRTFLKNDERAAATQSLPVLAKRLERGRGFLTLDGLIWLLQTDAKEIDPPEAFTGGAATDRDDNGKAATVPGRWERGNEPGALTGPVW